MTSSPADEFRFLDALSDSCSDFGQRLLLFPSATTFHTYSKNRYKNILPNENTRVKLTASSSQEGSDYINANFVNLPLNESEHMCYICTQAPLESTIPDFWKMVWEQKSSCIVSLTNLCENNRVKADRYWPSEEGTSEVYGDIQVIHKSHTYLGFFARRLLLIKEGIKREILQLHYLEWPDFGVPECSSDIRQIGHVSDLWRQHSAQKGLDGPLIVHCSAGVGRTGAFIAIHTGLKILEMGQVPNVMELVRIMRQQRNGMVQTVDQYEFIYTVLEDVISDPKLSCSQDQPFEFEAIMSPLSPCSPCSEERSSDTDSEELEEHQCNISVDNHLLRTRSSGYVAVPG